MRYLIVLLVLSIPSAWAQAPAFHDSQATGVAPVSAASPGAAAAPAPPMPVDPQAGRHLAPGQLAPSPGAPAATTASANDSSIVPGTSEVAGVPDAPLRPHRADAPPEASTLVIARGQDQTPDNAAEGGATTSSGNRLTFNIFMIAGLMILVLVVLMLIFQPRRAQV